MVMVQPGRLGGGADDGAARLFLVWTILALGWILAVRECARVIAAQPPPERTWAVADREDWRFLWQRFEFRWRRDE